MNGVNQDERKVAIPMNLQATAPTPEPRSHDRLLIGGSWQHSSGQQPIEVVSPVTERVIATVPAATTDDVDRAVAAARRAFVEGPWPG